MSLTVNVHEAKTQLSRLIDQAASGEEIIIARAGKPKARLVPYRETGKRREPGRWAGRVKMAADFDDTPEWLVDAFEGR